MAFVGVLLAVAVGLALVQAAPQMTYGKTCIETFAPCSSAAGCPPGYFCAGGSCCEGEDGPCHQALAEFMVNPVMDYVPQCRHDGYYEALGHTYFGLSYCVSPLGQAQGSGYGLGEPQSQTEEDCLEYYRCPAGDDIVPCPSDGVCPSGQFCFAHRTCCAGSKKKGPCIEALEKVLMTTSPGMVGHFLPSCEPEGHCSPVQCHGSTGHCWCSLPDCTEIPGSRRGPGQGKLTC